MAHPDRHLPGLKDIKKNPLSSDRGGRVYIDSTGAVSYGCLGVMIQPWEKVITA